MHLNPNLLDTSTPPIPEAYGWSEAYRGAMGPLINMAQAAPGNPPHPDLIARIGASASDPAGMRYGPIGGDQAFREAFAGEQSAIYGGEIGADEVAITAGCNLFLAGHARTPWRFTINLTL